MTPQQRECNMYVDEDMLDQIVSRKEYEAEKYYAKFGGRVVGPYDTEKDAYHDTKGDVEWIKTGENIILSVICANLADN
jgi:hypothetical protein